MTDNDNSNDLENFLGKSTHVQIPEDVQLRLRKRLVEFRGKLKNGELTVMKSSYRTHNRRTTIMRAGMIFGAAAVIILAVVLTLSPWSENPEKAYAAVVQQFESAKTMAYSLTIHKEGAPDTHQEIVYKEPGFSRLEMSFKKKPEDTELEEIYVVYDMSKKKSITVWPSSNGFMEMDFSNMSGITETNPEISVIEHIRSIPPNAENIPGKRSDNGRKLLGYLVREKGTEKTIWIDEASGEPEQIDVDFPDMKGTHIVISNIKFDVDLDDSLFDLTPPEGYKAMIIQNDTSQLTEKDLVNLLRFLADHTKNKVYPPILSDPGELIKFMQKFGDEPEKKVSGKEGQRQTDIMTRGMMFVMQIKFNNDWHYAGKDVKYGAKDTPVCWWKPDGAETYRVVYGDLSVHDVSSDQIKSSKFGNR